ncbi:MAG: hypothetical protein BWY29_00166 [Microgenomates group bacterium ADurb.Bin238]|jgi:hypothetical protein|nr:MAG: hypothetical protein BWY29_00166 [Microgenomates group bacterium ADurb.Bin238]
MSPYSYAGPGDDDDEEITVRLPRNLEFEEQLQRELSEQEAAEMTGVDISEAQEAWGQAVEDAGN